MGDTGSYFVGLMLASMTIVGTFYEESPTIGRHVMLAPLCVLAVPLYDFTSVMLIRPCPSLSCTTFGCSPCNSSIVAIVCRKSWNRIARTPALLSNGL